MYRDEPTAFELWSTLVGGLLIGAMLVLSVIGIRSLTKDPGEMNVAQEQNRAFVLNAPARTAAAAAFATHTVWAWANAGDSLASPIETGWTTQPVEQRPQMYALLGTTSSKRRRIAARALGLATSTARLLLLVPLAALAMGFAAFAMLSGAAAEYLPERRSSGPEGLALLWSIFFAPHVETTGPDPERHAEKTAALGQFDTPPEPTPTPPVQQQEKPKLTDLQQRTIEAVKERLAILEPGWHRVEFIASGLPPAGKACLTKLVRAGLLPAYGVEVDGREFRLAKEVR